MDTLQAGRLLPLLSVALLSACGGGGGGSDNDSVDFDNLDDAILKIPLPNSTGNLLCSNQADDMAVEDLPVIMESEVPEGGAEITTERVFENLEFDQPQALLQEPADDSYWYVVEKAGTVQRFDNDENASTTLEFLNITNRVTNDSLDSGLVSMAFHPDFAINGYVYVAYTGPSLSIIASDSLISYVSRFELDPVSETLLTGSEKILLQVEQPFDNNNGGNLAFGMDGYLYIAFGDGGGVNDPNNLTRSIRNLFGSFLRIDVDTGDPYAIPSDNPYAGRSICSDGSGSDACSEIYACGFRNPKRWSFDSVMGDLWAGDISTRTNEEIDTVVINGNYGWPFFVGTRFTNRTGADEDSEYVSPVKEYTRASGSSVTGGYVYRGTDIEDLIGVYIYGDFSSGELFQYYFNDGNEPGFEALLVDVSFDTGLSIAAFGEGNDGELYILNFDPVNPTGIYQVVEEEGPLLPPAP